MINSITDLFKKYFFLVATIIAVFLTLYPALHLSFFEDIYADLNFMVGVFGIYADNLRLTNVNIGYFFSQYGMITTLTMLAYKLFEFNSMAYFALNISLRILAAVSIYYFVAKWGRSKLAGFVAGTYFGVSYPGIENTTRVTLFTIYLAIIFMFIFLDKWLDFHAKPSFKRALSSIVFLIVLILVDPIRMVGTALLIVCGELYFLTSKLRKKILKSVEIRYLVLILVTTAVLSVVTGTLKKTPELQFKIIAPSVIFSALIKGSQPVVYSLWLFISNLMTPPQFLINGYIKPSSLAGFTQVMPVLGVLVLVSCFIRKRFSLAFLALAATIFSPLVAFSASSLTGWQSNWITITQLGGTVFIFSLLVIFSRWHQDKNLAKLGMLGIVIILSSLFAPWMLSPVPYNNSQSMFDFISRYYTIPSIGMAIIAAVVFIFLSRMIWENVNSISNLFRQKLSYLKFTERSAAVILSVLFCSYIVLIIFLHALTVQGFLLSEKKGIDAQKTDLFWNQLKTNFKNYRGSGTTEIVFIEQNGSFDQDYVKYLFPRRFSIYGLDILNPAQFKFIFNKSELEEELKNYQNSQLNNFKLYAFRFDGQQVVNIDSQIYPESFKNHFGQ